jgi:anti-sigma-K factor RskA
VHPRTTGEKYTVTFLQYFSQSGRRKVQRVSISQEKLRESFLDYIMGRLSDSDRSRFEERLLEDQDFSDAVALCEQELIDAYAMHRLQPDEARAVGLWMEASPDRLERVTIARVLLQATTRRKPRKHQTEVALAIAACLLVAATLYQIAGRLLNHRRETIQIAAGHIPLPPNQAPSAAATSGEAAKPDIVLLAAERIRGKQKSTTYLIHHERPIQLQVVLPGETERFGYQVRVASLADQDKILVQQNNLEAQFMAGQLYLTVTLPPGSLPPATYTASITRQGNTLLSTFTLKLVHE